MAALTWDQETLFGMDQHTIFDYSSGPDATTRTHATISRETLEYELKASEVDSTEAKGTVVPDEKVHYEATEGQCFIPGCTGKVVAETRDGDTKHYVSESRLCYKRS